MIWIGVAQDRVRVERSYDYDVPLRSVTRGIFLIRCVTVS
jgi:hypothetical protein